MRSAALVLVLLLVGAVLACQQSPLPTSPDQTSLGVSSWDEKITGGGEGIAGGEPIWVTASATDDGGEVKGQITYKYPSLNRDWHGIATCLGIFNDGGVAVVGGTISPNGDSSPPSGPYFYMAIREGGIGAGDEFRFVVTTDPSAVTAKCTGGETSFPGVITDGNFNIRVN